MHSVCYCQAFSPASRVVSTVERKTQAPGTHSYWCRRRDGEAEREGVASDTPGVLAPEDGAAAVVLLLSARRGQAPGFMVNITGREGMLPTALKTAAVPVMPPDRRSNQTGHMPTTARVTACESRA